MADCTTKGHKSSLDEPLSPPPPPTTIAHDIPVNQLLYVSNHSDTASSISHGVNPQDGRSHGAETTSDSPQPGGHGCSSRLNHMADVDDDEEGDSESFNPFDTQFGNDDDDLDGKNPSDDLPTPKSSRSGGDSDDDSESDSDRTLEEYPPNGQENPLVARSPAFQQAGPDSTLLSFLTQIQIQTEPNTAQDHNGTRRPTNGQSTRQQARPGLFQWEDELTGNQLYTQPIDGAHQHHDDDDDDDGDDNMRYDRNISSYYRHNQSNAHGVTQRVPLTPNVNAHHSHPGLAVSPVGNGYAVITTVDDDDNDDEEGRRGRSVSTSKPLSENLVHRDLPRPFQQADRFSSSKSVHIIPAARAELETSHQPGNRDDNGDDYDTTSNLGSCTCSVRPGQLCAHRSAEMHSRYPSSALDIRSVGGSDHHHRSTQGLAQRRSNQSFHAHHTAQQQQQQPPVDPYLSHPYSQYQQQHQHPYQDQVYAQQHRQYQSNLQSQHPSGDHHQLNRHGQREQHHARHPRQQYGHQYPHIRDDTSYGTAVSSQPTHGTHGTQITQQSSQVSDPYAMSAQYSVSNRDVQYNLPGVGNTPQTHQTPHNHHHHHHQHQQGRRQQYIYEQSEADDAYAQSSSYGGDDNDDLHLAALQYQLGQVVRDASQQQQQQQQQRAQQLHGEPHSREQPYQSPPGDLSHPNNVYFFPVLSSPTHPLLARPLGDCYSKHAGYGLPGALHNTESLRVQSLNMNMDAIENMLVNQDSSALLSSLQKRLSAEGTNMGIPHDRTGSALTTILPDDDDDGNHEGDNPSSFGIPSMAGGSKRTRAKLNGNAIQFDIPPIHKEILAMQESPSPLPPSQSPSPSPSPPLLFSDDSSCPETNHALVINTHHPGQTGNPEQQGETNSTTSILREQKKRRTVSAKPLVDEGHGECAIQDDMNHGYTTSTVPPGRALMRPYLPTHPVGIYGYPHGSAYEGLSQQEQSILSRGGQLPAQPPPRRLEATPTQTVRCAITTGSTLPFTQLQQDTTFSHRFPSGPPPSRAFFTSMRSSDDPDCSPRSSSHPASNAVQTANATTTVATTTVATTLTTASVSAPSSPIIIPAPYGGVTFQFDSQSQARQMDANMTPYQDTRYGVATAAPPPSPTMTPSGFPIYRSPREWRAPLPSLMGSSIERTPRNRLAYPQHLPRPQPRSPRFDPTESPPIVSAATSVATSVASFEALSCRIHQQFHDHLDANIHQPTSSQHYHVLEQRILSEQHPNGQDDHPMMLNTALCTGPTITLHGFDEALARNKIKVDQKQHNGDASGGNADNYSSYSSFASDSGSVAVQSKNVTSHARPEKPSTHGGADNDASGAITDHHKRAGRLIQALSPPPPTNASPDHMQLPCDSLSVAHLPPDYTDYSGYVYLPYVSFGADVNLPPPVDTVNPSPPPPPRPSSPGRGFPTRRPRNAGPFHVLSIRKTRVLHAPDGSRLPAGSIGTILIDRVEEYKTMSILDRFVHIYTYHHAYPLQIVNLDSTSSFRHLGHVHQHVNGVVTIRPRYNNKYDGGKYHAIIPHLKRFGTPQLPYVYDGFVYYYQYRRCYTLEDVEILCDEHKSNHFQLLLCQYYLYQRDKFTIHSRPGPLLNTLIAYDNHRLEQLLWLVREPPAKESSTADWFTYLIPPTLPKEHQHVAKMLYANTCMFTSCNQYYKIIFHPRIFSQTAHNNRRRGIPHFVGPFKRSMNDFKCFKLFITTYPFETPPPGVVLSSLIWSTMKTKPPRPRPNAFFIGEDAEFEGILFASSLETHGRSSFDPPPPVHYAPRLGPVSLRGNELRDRSYTSTSGLSGSLPVFYMYT